MPRKGFYFSRLEAHGRGREIAVLKLEKGLNVVSGASDTGKSYLVHCLNFMTGAKDPPKPIPESEGYETLWLEIVTWDGDTFTLERSLRGKDFRLYASGIDDLDESTEAEVLKATSSGNNRSISKFLLELIDARDVQLRTNADGKLRSVSFRDFAHVAIINEERIYTEGSPVRATGQFVSKTVEESFFRFLLTGTDDSSVITANENAETEGHQQARIEAIEDVIEATENAVRKLTEAPDEVQAQLEKLRTTIKQSTTAIAVNRDRLIQEQNRRRELWDAIQTSTARNEVLSRLVNRFSLLEQHYDSDLQRLRAMAEAGVYLSQMPITDCPMCGTENPWDSSDELGQLQRACEYEVQRIGSLREDLNSTVSDIRQELDNVDRGIKRSIRSYDKVTDQISQELLPAEEVTREELDSLLGLHVRLEQAVALTEQIKRLKESVEEIRNSAPKPRRASEAEGQTAVSTSETDAFCKVVEKLLAEWKFPDAGRVTFSETKQDLVINGKDRASHGKGIRALSYSAFVIGLLRFCRKNKRNHPGIVVLDSPLVAYREPDSQKAVKAAGVKEEFYRSLAKPSKETQVIIFENEDPPKDVVAAISYTHFSGDKKGKTRSGFFPN